MRIIPGFSRWLWLGVALAAACSDDGLANQSTGLAETSSTSAAASGDPQSLTGAGDSGTTLGRDESSDGLPPGPSTSTASDGSGPASDSTGLEVASGSGSDTGSGSGSTTGEPPSACAAGCAVEFLCGTEWMSAEDCVTWCEANLIEANAFSPFCRDAWEGVSACVATLTCEEFAVWADPMMFPYPCSDADTALAIECKGQ